MERENTFRTVARPMAKRSARVVLLPTSGMRSLPDFLIIGGQRCGTTSLYRYLARHPAVMPAILNKGIHYFDTNFDKGVGWYRSHFPTLLGKRIRARRVRATRVLTGEGSPYYAFHPLVARRAADLIPDARSILMLRDPIERAYSHYQHEVARGFEELSFEEALEAEETRLHGEEARLIADPSAYSFEHQHHSYVARGAYVRQIDRWLAHFPEEQLLIVDSGDFFTDPEAGFRRVLRFLGLADHTLPKYGKMNAHSYERMSPRALAFLRARFGSLDEELFDRLGRRFSWADRTG